MTSPLITQVTGVCLVELCLWLTDSPYGFGPKASWFCLSPRFEVLAVVVNDRQMVEGLSRPRLF